MKFLESVLRGYADTKDNSVIGDLTASPLITVVTDSNGFFNLHEGEHFFKIVKDNSDYSIKEVTLDKAHNGATAKDATLGTLDGQPAFIANEPVVFTKGDTVYFTLSDSINPYTMKHVMQAEGKGDSNSIEYKLLLAFTAFAKDEFRFAESFNSDITEPIFIGAENDHDFPDISSYKDYVKPTPASMTAPQPTQSGSGAGSSAGAQPASAAGKGGTGK